MFSETGLAIDELFIGETNFIANASNFASFVYHNFSDMNWVGFYFLSNNELVLGPFQGNPACVRIALGKGVCGNSALQRKAIIVENVNDFPGYIACDPHSKSEMVIPVIHSGKLYGVFDIDSPVQNRVSVKELELFESYLELLLNSSNLIPLECYYHI